MAFLSDLLEITWDLCKEASGSGCRLSRVLLVRVPEMYIYPLSCHK